MGLKTTSDIIKDLTKILLEVINEADPLIGAPGGHIYLAMNAHGVDLTSFQLFMASLVRLGLLTHRNDCYHITQAGKDYIRNFTNPVETTSAKA